MTKSVYEKDIMLNTQIFLFQNALYFSASCEVDKQDSRDQVRVNRVGCVALLQYYY